MTRKTKQVWVVKQNTKKPVSAPVIVHIKPWLAPQAGRPSTSVGAKREDGVTEKGPKQQNAHKSEYVRKTLPEKLRPSYRIVLRTKGDKSLYIATLDIFGNVQKTRYKKVLGDNWYTVGNQVHHRVNVDSSSIVVVKTIPKLAKQSVHLNESLTKIDTEPKQMIIKVNPDLQGKNIDLNILFKRFKEMEQDFVRVQKKNVKASEHNQKWLAKKDDIQKKSQQLEERKKDLLSRKSDFVREEMSRRYMRSTLENRTLLEREFDQRSEFLRDLWIRDKMEEFVKALTRLTYELGLKSSKLIFKAIKDRLTAHSSDQ